MGTPSQKNLKKNEQKNKKINELKQNKTTTLYDLVLCLALITFL